MRILVTASMIAGLAGGAQMANARPAPSYRAVVIESPRPEANGLFESAGDDSPPDINGDGVADIFAYNQSYDGADTGHVFIFSGATRRLLRTIANPRPQVGSGFGPVLNLGDVNHDGVADFAVSAPGEDVGANQGQGVLWVFEGKTGNVLYEVNDPQPAAGAGFGFGVSTGDLNGDGIRDLVLVDGSYDATTVPGTGTVYAFSGKDGRLLWQVPNPSGTPPSALSVHDTGDVNGDGVDDILVGAPPPFGVPGVGHAYLLDGRNGRVIRTLTDPTESPSSGFGSFWNGGPGAPGDINGDGVRDISVAASTEDVGGLSKAGALFLFSGRNGSLIREITSPLPQQLGFFGYDSALAGDLTGSGHQDLLVTQTGCCFHSSVMAKGGAWVFDPRTGRMLVDFTQSAPGAGQQLETVGDLNGDGYPDYVLGAPRTDVGSNAFQGRIYVELSSGPRLRPQLTDYVRPHSRRTLPYVFTVTGRVIAPLGLISPCRTGRVSITANAGRQTLRTWVRKVRSDCTYRARIVIPSQPGLAGRTVALVVRFGGNNIIVPARAKKLIVRAG